MRQPDDLDASRSLGAAHSSSTYQGRFPPWMVALRCWVERAPCTGETYVLTRTEPGSGRSRFRCWCQRSGPLPRPSGFGRSLRDRRGREKRLRRSESVVSRGYSRFGDAHPRRSPNRESLQPRINRPTFRINVFQAAGPALCGKRALVTLMPFATVLSLTPSSRAIARSLMPRSRRWAAFDPISR